MIAIQRAVRADAARACSVRIYQRRMLDNDDDADSPLPLLACGHAWDGRAPWEEMRVVLKAIIEEPAGPRPGVSVGHHCRQCRPTEEGDRFASLAEGWAWLREMNARWPARARTWVRC